MTSVMFLGPEIDLIMYSEPTPDMIEYNIMSTQLIKIVLPTIISIRVFLCNITLFSITQPGANYAP